MMGNLPKNRTVKYLPYAFTEHGVTMLANVLKSKKAIKMSIAIVRAFISLKQLALQHKGLAEKLEDLRSELHERVGEHDTQLAAIYNAIEKLLHEKEAQKKWEDRERIGFKNQ
jgi:phage regulator Rha-like protein